ncbi:hypothetical protein EV663_11669 [Rhodovulum bhavnagarense]|uniref:Uncharacterized protein n=1 Tax=Rhodovulum bhavnagarense TaxID=992286 RepID=A0A4R2RAM6_9RHOB|nr:hypothetical protein [Rhodovulum bhavnagarense]TCP59773.1 hypothetical protein EV663_11669 [Rhodovulum bhavnagarense]
MQFTILTKPDHDKTEVRKRFVDGVEDKDHFKFSSEWWPSKLTLDLSELYHIYRRPGEVIPGLIDNPRAILAFGHPEKSGVCSHKAEGWSCAPADILVLDGDGIDYPDGYSDATLIADPHSTIEAVLASIGLAGIRCMVVLSSKAGMAGKFRAHIFVELAKHYRLEDLNALLKEWSKELPWVDPIMSAAHTLTSCRPWLEHEHLPERVFLFDGMCPTLDTPEARGMVELLKMPSRGKPGQVYRLNEDRIRNDEWVTRECWNFVLNCKRRHMTEDETIEALRAEFARIPAPRSAWKKMRKPMKDAVTGERLDEELGDARRMYRDMHGGKAKTYGEPAYQEPTTTLDDATREMRKAVLSQVDREGVFLNKVSLGVGKTHEIVDYATRDDRKVLILAPNHERCVEIVERLEAARHKRMDELMDAYGAMSVIENDGWVFRPWETWKGRSADGMCDRLDVVNEALRAGVSLFKDVCGFPIGDNDAGPRCPHFSRCAYARQVMEFWRNNWVVPVQMISHLSRLAGEADLIIIDEGCVDELARQKSVNLEELMAPRSDRLNELSRRAYRDLMDGERRMTREEIEEALSLDLELRHVPEVTPDMPDDEIVERCAPGDFRPGCVSIWKGLLAEMDGGCNYIHVFYFEEEVDRKKVGRWVAEVSWRVEPKLLSQVETVLLFDATPNITALRAHFPELEVAEFEAPAQNTHVVQCYDTSGSRASILNPFDKSKDLKKWTQAEAGYKKKREQVAALLRAQPGYTVAVVPKDYREAMEAEHTFERVVFAHYGKVQGQDRWEFPDGTKLHGAEIDNLFLIGRYAPMPYVMESEARKHHCDEDAVTKMGGWYREVPVELADGVAGVMPVHDDPRVDAVFKAVWRDTQMQAFGRGRSVRRESRLRVFILHNMPLEVSVAEVVPASVMMRRVGDVTLLSEVEVDRVFGFGGRNTREVKKRCVVTHKYWREEGQKRPYECAVADGADVDRAMRDVGAVRWEAVR